MSPARVSEAVMEASKTSAAVSHRLPFTIYVLDVCKTAIQATFGGYGTGRWTGSDYITHACIAKQEYIKAVLSLLYANVAVPIAPAFQSARAAFCLCSCH